MRLRVPPSLLLGALGLAVEMPVCAAQDPTAISPFLPANGQSAAVATEATPIELHGVMVTPEGMRFSIYNPAKKSATWVGLNESGSAYAVRSYSVVEGADQVKVDYEGSTLTLGLKTPKIASLAAPPAQMMPGPNGPQFVRGGPNAVTQSVVVNPTPADEAARLQAVVEAVAARRAARNQAAQQVGTGTPATPVMVPANGTQTTAPQQNPAQRQGQGQRRNQRQQN